MSTFDLISTFNSTYVIITTVIQLSIILIFLTYTNNSKILEEFFGYILFLPFYILGVIVASFFIVLILYYFAVVFFYIFNISFDFENYKKFIYIFPNFLLVLFFVFMVLRDEIENVFCFFKDPYRYRIRKEITKITGLKENQIKNKDYLEKSIKDLIVKFFNPIEADKSIKKSNILLLNRNKMYIKNSFKNKACSAVNNEVVKAIYSYKDHVINIDDYIKKCNEKNEILIDLLNSNEVFYQLRLSVRKINKKIDLSKGFEFDANVDYKEFLDKIKYTLNNYKLSNPDQNEINECLIETEKVLKSSNAIVWKILVPTIVAIVSGMVVVIINYYFINWM